MTRSTVSLKPRIGHINIIQFRQKELLSTLTVIARSASFSKKYGPPVQNPRQTVTRCGLHLFFANHTWASHVLRTLNTAILAINEAIEVKMCFILKLSLFLKYRSIMKTHCCAPVSLTLNSQNCQTVLFHSCLKAT